MTDLSREAAEVLRPFAPHAVTDVTGFGLLGHAHEMAERSGVRIELDAASLPLCPARSRLRRRASGPAATGATATSLRPHVDADGVPEDLLALAYDPQTSGGLLIALPADKGAVLAATFAARGLFLARIGRVVEGAGVALA